MTIPTKTIGGLLKLDTVSSNLLLDEFFTIQSDLVSAIRTSSVYFSEIKKVLENAEKNHHNTIIRCNFFLGMIYRIVENNTIALTHFLISANMGHVKSIHFVAAIYYYLPNKKLYKKWVKKGARMKDLESQHSLGFYYYEKGRYDISEYWFKLSAASGDKDSIRMLKYMRYYKKSESDIKNECNICFARSVDCKLNCGCKLCYLCANQCQMDNNKCPICYKKIEKINKMTDDERVLAECNINTKKDYNLWLLKNHPDRTDNPNIKLVQAVIAAYKNIFSV